MLSHLHPHPTVVSSLSGARAAASVWGGPLQRGILSGKAWPEAETEEKSLPVRAQRGKQGEADF